MSAKVTSVKEKRAIKKNNLKRLCSEMSKHVNDAVDREIIKRFKVIIDTEEQDITKKILDILLKYPETTQVNEFNESLQPYIKHYLFMIKRSKKNEMTA